ncbi:MAG TPA: hypothetical protein VIT44_06910 [Cyclobacteriaceae bacterium]
MRVWSSVFICLLVSSLALAQEAQPQKPAATQMLEGNYTLDDRFNLVKTKSQTFQDYKVIKEFVLEGFWKITKDSVRKGKEDLKAAKAKIAQLENDVLIAKNNLQAKEESVAGITYDSTHISVIGIPFSKGAFIILVTVVVVGLVLLLLALLGALRFSRSNLKERVLTVDLLTKEFDEYKKKALDKETKILRQLQDERNKYHASPR